MFSAFFWCIFGVMLIVVANTWVARIPFARLAAGIALYMQLGGVFSVIAGVVFFFHSGPVTTSERIDGFRDWPGLTALGPGQV